MAKPRGRAYGLYAAIPLTGLCMLVAFLATIQTGCPSPVTPPCDPAIACASVNLGSNPICEAYQARPFFRAGNLHPSRGIWVTYRIDAVSLNPPPASPPSAFTSRQVQPGQQADLGCKYAQTSAGSDKYFLYTYTPVSACFLDDAKCTQPTEIAPAARDCSKETMCTGPDCINYQFDSVPGSAEEAKARAEVDKAIQDTLSTPTLNSVSLAGLLGIKMLCPGRGSISIQGSDFLETGSSCSTFLQLRPAPSILSLRLSLPTRLSGKFGRTLNQSAAFDFPDSLYSPTLEWFDANGSLGNERVARIELSPGLVKIIGSRHYCIWVRTKNP